MRSGHIGGPRQRAIVMSVSDTIITTWLTAIARFRQARAAWLEWKSRNPYPTRDILPDDIEQERAFLAEWELGSEGVRSQQGREYRGGAHRSSPTGFAPAPA